MWWSDREIICKNLKALQILRQVFFCIWAILGGQVGSYSWGRLGHMVRTDRAILIGQAGSYGQDRSGYTHGEGRVIWSEQIGLYP